MSSTSLTCSIPPLITPSLAPLYGLDIPKLLTEGTIIASKRRWTATDAAKAFDGDYTSRYFAADSTEPCFLGKDFGEGAQVKLTKVRLHPEAPSVGGHQATARLTLANIQVKEAIAADYQARVLLLLGIPTASASPAVRFAIEFYV